MSKTYQCQKDEVIIEPQLLEQHYPRVEAEPDDDGRQGEDQDDNEQSEPCDVLGCQPWVHRRRR